MGKEIRILHVFGRLDRGGAEALIMNIYRNINRTKFQFDFIKHTEDKCDFDEEIMKLGGRIYSVPRYNGKNHFYYINQWKNFFKEHTEYYIVHGHIRSTASIYLGIAKSFGLVTIAHSHSTASRGYFIERLIKGIMQFPIKYKADYLFACSNKAGEWLFGNRIIKNKSYMVFKNAIDINKYKFNKNKRNEIRKLLNVENKFVIGHVGSFTRPKNHKFLIKVFNEVYKKNKNSVLLLVGDGGLRESIIEQANCLGISNNVILIGNVPDVQEYLQAMDIFLFPSLFEGLGISLVEAQASGLPCIVSNNIPAEAFVINEVKVLKLDIILWANNILNYQNHKRVVVLPEKFKSAGYDIISSANELINFYSAVLKNREAYNA